jgi:hypothetical protein
MMRTKIITKNQEETEPATRIDTQSNLKSYQHAMDLIFGSRFLKNVNRTMDQEKQRNKVKEKRTDD